MLVFFLLIIRCSIQFAEGAGMEISISKVIGEDGEQWSVTAGGVSIKFKDQASAVEFSEKLKERVEAPHDLPDSILEETKKTLEAEEA